LGLNPTNVQQSIETINSAPVAIESASMQYLQTISNINNQVTQAGSIAAGAGSDPSFTAAVQQAVVNVANMSVVINNAKSKINSSLDATSSAIEQLTTALQSMQSVQQNAQQNAPDAQQAADSGNGAYASKGVFNYKEAQLAADPLAQIPPMEDAGLGGVEDMGQVDDFGPFENASELLEKLEGMGRAESENKLLSYVSDPQAQEMTRKTMEIVFEYGLNSQEQLEEISQVWDFLPDAIKIENEQMTSIEGEYVNNQEQTMANLENINKMVKASNDEIIKLAQAGKPKSFNFQKQAQHKTNENVILWGPESRNNVDPFTGEPTSDWHVLERNKGWGFRIGDRWDIDFEAFWRGNIMDKYSRPYRDGEGNWVGGYIEKRFEVDRWQPEENTYMLKPGEKRKARPAELGNMEARLEAYRGNEDKVFNWKEASSKKNTKISDMQFEKDIPEGVVEVTASRWDYKDFLIVFAPNIRGTIMDRNGGLPEEESYKYYSNSDPTKSGSATSLREAVSKIESMQFDEQNVSDPLGDPLDESGAFNSLAYSEKSDIKTSSGMEDYIATRAKSIYHKIKSSKPGMPNQEVINLAAANVYKSLNANAKSFLDHEGPGSGIEFVKNILDETSDAQQGLGQIAASSKKKECNGFCSI